MAHSMGIPLADKTVHTYTTSRREESGQVFSGTIAKMCGRYTLRIRMAEMQAVIRVVRTLQDWNYLFSIDFGLV